MRKISAKLHVASVTFPIVPIHVVMGIYLTCTKCFWSSEFCLQGLNTLFANKCRPGQVNPLRTRIISPNTAAGCSQPVLQTNFAELPPMCFPKVVLNLLNSQQMTNVGVALEGFRGTHVRIHMFGQNESIQVNFKSSNFVSVRNATSFLAQPRLRKDNSVGVLQ